HPLINTLKEASINSPFSQLYVTERSDAVMLLDASIAPVIFAQTCAFDFRECTSLVMVQIAGVSAMVLPRLEEICSHYRIWCVPSFAEYLYTTLLSIMEEYCS